MTRKKTSESMKRRVAGKQYYHCANIPGSNLSWLQDYNCPLWQIEQDHKGCFDESGYHVTPIVGLISDTMRQEDQLHALCNNCHNVKYANMGSQ